MDDANARLGRPRGETRRIRRSKRDAVEPACRVDELRFETRDLHQREAIPRLGIAHPTNQHETVRGDVRIAVFARVDLREVDPRVVARVRIGERLDFRYGDDVASARVVARDDREIERADGRVDDRLRDAGGEDHDDGVGGWALFDLESQGSCGDGSCRRCDGCRRRLRADERRRWFIRYGLRAIDQHRARQRHADEEDVEQHEAEDE